MTSPATPFWDRVWAKVNKDGPVVRPELGPCWIWIGAGQKDGYGNMTWEGKGYHVHRLVWMKWHGGKIPPGLCILHTCDVKRCVSPEHLFLGTKSDNTADMHQKRRGWVHTKPELKRIGTQQPDAKLTDDRVRTLRTEIGEGRATRADFAQRYGTSWSVIDNAYRRKTWKHVE